ncbi:GAF domain-containing protein [Marinivivus vitaminiproducens]|uniref:GAF domain-containing protein n=1 Tax=Marinivivus vitaminiproducens TaxID=3035935 RepID=UPI002799EEA2|nr:helix-turn-helix domain-containing protein [Geminicoccaceae bacterium SCSIO 64248]
MAASWRRCARQHSLDPDVTPDMHRLPDTELLECRQEMEPLLRSAFPALERLQGATGDHGVCQLLTNADGISLHWSGAAGDEAELQAWGLCRGVDWSEAASGTNGVGTSLIERRTLVVQHEHHYYARALKITCISAPVFDHAGTLAGAVNVTFYGSTSTQAPAGLLASAVADTARQIEIDHFHHHFHDARISSLPWALRCGAVLLATDRDDVIVGASRGARHVLGLNDAAIREGVIAADRIHALANRVEDDGLDTAEHGALRRALLRERGNVTAASRRLGVSLATIKRKISHRHLERRSRN